MKLALEVLPRRFAIAQLPPGAPLPAWGSSGAFSFVGRTPDELSIICEEDLVPVDAKCERGWRCLEVEGPFPLTAVGVAAELTRILAASGISVLVVSTYNTDYVLLLESVLEGAIEVIVGAGHTLTR